MAGGGNRRGAGPEEVRIGTANVFAALDTLKKKKKPAKKQAPEPVKPEVTWTPAPLTTKSWADVEDDDDYYATTAPPLPVWGTQENDAAAGQEDDREHSALEQVHLAFPTARLRPLLYMPVHICAAVSEQNSVTPHRCKTLFLYLFIYVCCMHIMMLCRVNKWCCSL